jgi:hypothetical protein
MASSLCRPWKWRCYGGMFRVTFNLSHLCRNLSHMPTFESFSSPWPCCAAIPKHINAQWLWMSSAMSSQHHEWTWWPVGAFPHPIFWTQVSAKVSSLYVTLRLSYAQHWMNIPVWILARLIPLPPTSGSRKTGPITNQPSYFTRNGLPPPSTTEIRSSCKRRRR